MNNTDSKRQNNSGISLLGSKLWEIFTNYNCRTGGWLVLLNTATTRDKPGEIAEARPRTLPDS